MKNRIGIFDSGLGGLSVLNELIKILPNEDYLFYEDSINNPYGEKNDLELLKIARNAVDYLLKNSCKIIVIACNTATASCIKKLREIYNDVIFVGIVPAIKVACDRKYKYTILLSTTYTAKSRRVDELINEYKTENQIIVNISGKNLANLIELGKMDEVDQLLLEMLSEYDGVADSIVLGCTHYSLIKDKIQKVLPSVDLIDGANGVAREVKRQLSEHNLLSNSNTEGEIIIKNTKNDDLIKRSFEILNSLDK